MFITDERYYAEIADAIRYINGTSRSYSPSQMAEAILDLSASGYNTAIADYLATKQSPSTRLIGNSASFIMESAFTGTSMFTMTRYPRVTEIGSYAFKDCPTLRLAQFPRCVTLNDEAFAGCSLLSMVVLGSVTLVGRSAFQNCVALQSANLPECEEIEYSAFLGCTALRSVSLPNCTTLYPSAFCDCTSLEGISLPKSQTIPLTDVFRGCTSLSYAVLPNTTSVFETFYGCTALTSVSIPKCSNVKDFAFFGCSSLRRISIPKCEAIGLSAFIGCFSGMSVDLVGVSSVPALVNDAGSVINANKVFANAAIRVPESLYSDFLSNKQWLTVSKMIVSVW